MKDVKFTIDRNRHKGSIIRFNQNFCYVASPSITCAILRVLTQEHLIDVWAAFKELFDD